VLDCLHSQPQKVLKTLGLETRVLRNVLRFVLRRPERRMTSKTHRPQAEDALLAPSRYHR
jgi:hypothetical protein